MVMNDDDLSYVPQVEVRRFKGRCIRQNSAFRGEFGRHKTHHLQSLESWQPLGKTLLKVKLLVGYM